MAEEFQRAMAEKEAELESLRQALEELQKRVEEAPLIAQAAPQPQAEAVEDWDFDEDEDEDEETEPVPSKTEGSGPAEEPEEKYPYYDEDEDNEEDEDEDEDEDKDEDEDGGLSITDMILSFARDYEAKSIFERMELEGKTVMEITLAELGEEAEKQFQSRRAAR